MPTVKKLEPIIGVIQCKLCRADKPYQNKQIGSEADPKNVGGRIISGLKLCKASPGTMRYLS